MRRALIAVLPALVGAGALAAGPAAAQYNGPFLSWPGKVQPTDAAPPAPVPAPPPVAEAPPPPEPAIAPLPQPEPRAELEPAPQPRAMTLPAPHYEQPAAQPRAEITAPAPLAPAPVQPPAPVHETIAVNAPPAATYAHQQPRPPQVYPGPRLATQTVVRTHPRLRLTTSETALLAKATPPKAAPAAPVPQVAAQAVQPSHTGRQTVAKAAKIQPTAQPAAQPTVQQTAEVADQHSHLPPHIYSVARQYGLQPDPDPLPAQFFNDQAAQDMAAPPGPLPPRPVPGSQTVNSTAQANTPANRARAIALDTQPPDGGE